jgi:hypothetical protein
MKRKKTELEKAMDKIEVARVALSVIDQWAEVKLEGDGVIFLLPKEVLRVTGEALRKLREA